MNETKKFRKARFYHIILISDNVEGLNIIKQVDRLYTEDIERDFEDAITDSFKTHVSSMSKPRVYEKVYYDNGRPILCKVCRDSMHSNFIVMPIEGEF